MKKNLLLLSIALISILLLMYYQNFIWIDKCQGWSDCPFGPSPSLEEMAAYEQLQKQRLNSLILIYGILGSCLLFSLFKIARLYKSK